MYPKLYYQSENYVALMPYFFQILLQISNGYSSANGIKTKEVNATVHWKRLRNMFILMIVMVEDEFNMWLVGYCLDHVKRKLNRGTCV